MTVPEFRAPGDPGSPAAPSDRRLEPLIVGADGGRYDALIERYADRGDAGELSLCTRGLHTWYRNDTGQKQRGRKVQPPRFSEHRATDLVETAADPALRVYQCPVGAHFHIGRQPRPGRVGPFGHPVKVKRLTSDQVAEKGLITPYEAAQLIGVDVDRVAELARDPNGLGLRWVQAPGGEPRPLILRRGVIRMRDLGEK